MAQPKPVRLRVARPYSTLKKSILRSTSSIPRKSDSFYRQMFENNRAVQIIVNPDEGQIIDANPAACRFYGYTHQQLTALRISDLNTMPVPQIKTLMNQVVSEKGIIFQAQHRLASGEVRDVEVFSGLVLIDQVTHLYSIIQDITERKHAEQALRDSERYYRQMFENNPAIQFMVDPDDGRMVDANPAACRFYGYTREQFATLRITDLNIAPSAEVKAIVQRITSGHGLTFETRHRLASGEMRDVQVFAGTLDIAGRIQNYAIVQDITERKHAEQARRESEVLFRLFVQNMPDSSAIMFDTNMRIILAEGPFIKSFGGLEKNLLGHTPQEALPEQIAESISPVYRRALSGETFRYERVTETYSYESFVSPVRDEQGKIIGGMILSHDITKHHQAALALRESETRYHSVVESMGEGVVLQTRDGVIQTCNPAAEAILGLSAEQMMGRTSIDPRWRSIHEDGTPFPGETHPAMVTLQSGQPQDNVIMGVHKPDDSLVWISIKSRPLFKPGESLPYAVVATFTDITARKEIEEELRASQQRFQTLVDLAPIAIIENDPQGKLIYCNKVWMEISGQSLSSPSTMTEPIHPDDFPRLRDAYQRMAETDQPINNLTVRQRLPDGSIRWVTGNAIPVRDQTGTIISYIAAMIDITDRKRLEDDLRASQQRFQTLVDLAPIGIVERNAQGKPIYYNRLWTDITGVSLSSTASANEPVHPDDLHLVKAAQQRMVETGQPINNLSVRYLHLDGSIGWVTANAISTRDEAGNLTGFISAAIDITDRKRLEDELRASHQRFQTLVDLAPIGIIENDTEGKATYYNKAWTEMTGVSLSGSSGGQHPIHPDDVPLVRAAQRQMAETGQPIKNLTVRYLRPDGNITWLSGNSVPIKNQSGSTTGYIGTLLDITDRKRLEEELRQREQQLSLITSHIQDMVTYSDARDLFMYASPSVRAVIGVEPGEIVGKSRRELVHPDDWARMSAIRQQAIDSSNSTFKVEGRLRHRDGHYIDIETTGTLIYDASGQHQGDVYVTRDVTERNRLQDSLRRSEEKFRLIAENTSDGVIVYDHSSRSITYASPAYDRLFGREIGETAGRMLTEMQEFIHPDDKERVVSSMITAIKDRKDNWISDYRSQHKKGHYFWREDHATFIYSTDGQFISAYIISRDITERKRLEEELRSSEEHLRLISDNMQDFVTQNNTQGQMTFVSASAYNMLGYRPEDLLGKSSLYLIHPDDREQVGKIFRAAHADRTRQFILNARLRHADGHYIPVETVGRFVQDTQGNLVSGVFVSRDVTERNRLLDDLRLSEQRLRTITDNVADMVSLTDGTGNNIFTSNSVRNVLGYEPETLNNQPLATFIHPDDLPIVYQALDSVLKAGQDTFQFNCRVRHADGHFVNTETTGKFIPDGKTASMGSVLITRDISQRLAIQELIIQQETLKNNLEKEKELSRLKTRMMERITHEFRTPLSVIQSSVDTLTTYYDRLSPEKRSHKAETIFSEIKHIVEMLDDISLTVRGTFLPGHLKRKDINLSALCNQITRELSRTLNLQDKFQFDMPADIHLHGDPEVLTSIITQLLENAAYFSRPAEPVQIQLRPLENQLQLRIIDQGVGIAPEELPRIFEPFYRGSNIDERAGLGIGLSIARAGVEAHGGTITVESQLGKGTTITLTLPV